MSRTSLALLALAAGTLAACSGDPTNAVAPSSSAEPAFSPTGVSRSVARSGDVVPGQYIVLLKAGPTDAGVLARTKLGAGAARVHATYSNVIRGFAAELTAAELARLGTDPDVVAIEPDPVITVSGTQTSAPWGLDRIDQSALPLSTTYTYANDGSGVTVYIVDTGINPAHTDFGGRASGGYDAITAGGTAADCHGHGTHVAGTVGGTKYGVAKGVKLVAVRVLDCAGSGTGSTILSGLDWVVAQKRANPATPMVVNMSLGGSAASIIDSAVNNVILAGITAVVAAGNNGGDACATSPARLAAAITVGASDASDTFAYFSNRGSCVDLSAPGVSIVSDWYASTTGTTTMSGTSMASPHVAGAAALYLAANRTATPAQVQSALVNNASVGRLLSLPTGTVNRLLNITFLAPVVVPAPIVSVTPPTSSVAVGGTVALTATIANPVAGGTLAWVSRNTAVATVSANGASAANALGVAAGTSYVVATYTAGAVSVRDSMLVTVTAPPPPTGGSRLVSAIATNPCASLKGGSTAIGTALVSTSCVAGDASQQFTTPAAGVSGAVKTAAGLCIMAAQSGAEGAALIAATCDGSASQVWTVNAAGEWRGGVASKCAGVYGGSSTPGTPVVYYTCNGSIAKKWSVAAF